MVGAGRSRDDALAIGRARARRLPSLRRAGRPDVRVRQRRGAGRRPRAARCTAPTARSRPASPRSRCPECFLGLVPGWGGTYLLPNLVGAEKAVEVIIANPLNKNTMMSGARAFELGIVDVLFEPADFLEQSLAWAGDVLTGRARVERAPVERDQQVWDGALRSARDRRQSGPRRRSGAVPRARPDPPRPHGRQGHRVRGRGRGAGRPHHGRRAPSRALRVRPRQAPGEEAGRGARQGPRPPGDQRRRRRRRPDGQPARAALRPAARGPRRPHRPRPGAGRQGCRLRPRRDRRPACQEADQPRRGEPAQGPGHRLDSKGAFAEADLVIEAVFEELDVKKQVFAEVEAVVCPTACS